MVHTPKIIGFGKGIPAQNHRGRMNCTELRRNAWPNAPANYGCVYLISNIGHPSDDRIKKSTAELRQIYINISIAENVRVRKDRAAQKKIILSRIFKKMPLSK